MPISPEAFQRTQTHNVTSEVKNHSVNSTGWVQNRVGQLLLELLLELLLLLLLLLLPLLLLLLPLLLLHVFIT